MIVTNNIKVKDFFKEEALMFVEGGIKDVFVAVRDCVHKGHTILTHPLSGSVKPTETPFKSILLTETTGSLNLESLNLIEQAILMLDHLENNSVTGIRYKKIWENIGKQQLTGPERKILEDFREIDFTLFSNAIAAD